MAKIGVEDLSHNIFDHLGQKSQNIQFTLHGGRPSVPWSNDLKIIENISWDL